MKAHTASLINAVILIVMSLWAFVSIGMSSFTALIPAIAGIILLGCYIGVKAENKIVAHIAVVVTLLILIALFMPLRSALQSMNTGSLLRAILMIGSTAFALVFFIKSFRDARRAREAQET